MTVPQPAVVPAHPATFAALAVPNFRRYVSGQSLSLIGTWVETVAQALLVLRLTHSGTILGLTTAARYAPILLLSPYAGLLVDRYSKRRVLLGTQAGLGLVSAALGAAVLTGDIRLWQVVVLALAFGTLSALDNPARQAFVQEVVGRDLVRNAVTLNTTLVNVARVIGPTVAAVLASTVGLGWCFVVNAVSFGFVIVSLLSLDTRRLHPVPPVPRGRGQLRAGLRYAARVPEIARPLLMMAVIGAFTFEFEVSLPLLAEKTFHGTSTTYSWLIGALGAGAVVGGLYAARSARTGVASLTRAALGFAIAIGLVAVAPTFPTAVAACVLAGVATVIFLTTGNATVQLASEPDYRGRVTALWSMALVGTTPIGSPIIGALSDVAGPRYALGLGAAACLAAAVIGRWPGLSGGRGGVLLCRRADLGERPGVTCSRDFAPVFERPRHGRFPLTWILVKSPEFVMPAHQAGREAGRSPARGRCHTGADVGGTMSDRVVDRAAAHATPTELAIRDWLLVGLSFATGIYEAIVFLTFGKVFTAAQTGNLVLLGIGVAGTKEPAGPNPVTVVISLAAFAVGVALAIPILKAFRGDRETADHKVFHAWPRRVSIALAMALILQVAFLVVWVTAASPASLAYILMALSALALGLQANAIRSLNVPSISTTAFTAAYIDVFSGLATWSLTAYSARRLVASLVGMAAGACLGDVMLRHAHPYAPVVPAVVTAVVIAIAWTALKPRTTSGLAGQQSLPVQQAVK